MTKNYLFLCSLLFALNGCASLHKQASDNTALPDSMKVFSKTMQAAVLDVAISKDGSRIYVSDMTGYLYCFDKTGKELWAHKYYIDIDKHMESIKINSKDIKFKSKESAIQEFFNSSSATWYYRDFNHQIPKTELEKLALKVYGKVDLSEDDSAICATKYDWSMIVDGNKRLIKFNIIGANSFSTDGNMSVSDSIPAQQEADPAGDALFVFPYNEDNPVYYLMTDIPISLNDVPVKVCGKYFGGYLEGRPVRSGYIHGKGEHSKFLPGEGEAIGGACIDYALVQKTGKTESGKEKLSFRLLDRNTMKDAFYMDYYDCYLACSTSAVVVNGSVYESKFKTSWPLSVKPDTVTGLEFSADGSHFAVWGLTKDNHVQFVDYDVATRKPRHMYTFPETMVVKLSSKYLITTTDVKTFNIYEIKY